jgi:hypothetical protein
VIRFVDQHRGWARERGLLPALGRYVANYLLKVGYIPDSDFERDEHWPWGTTNGASVLRYLSQDPEAVAALAPAADTLVAVSTTRYFADAAEHGSDLDASLRHLFMGVDPIDTGQAEAALAHARDDDANWKGFWNTISSGLGLLPDNLGLVAPRATAPMESLLQELGWLGAPPPLTKTKTAVEAANDQAHVRQLALVGAAAFAFLKGNHELSDDTPPPPMWADTPTHYVDALEAWAKQGGEQSVITARRRVKAAVAAADEGSCKDLQSCPSR